MQFEISFGKRAVSSNALATRDLRAASQYSVEAASATERMFGSMERGGLPVDSATKEALRTIWAEFAARIDDEISYRRTPNTATKRAQS